MKQAVTEMKQYANILGALRKGLIEEGFSPDKAEDIIATMEAAQHLERLLNKTKEVLADE